MPKKPTKKEIHVLYGNPPEAEVKRLKALGYTVEIKPRAEYDQKTGICGDAT